MIKSVFAVTGFPVHVHGCFYKEYVNVETNGWLAGDDYSGAN